MTDHAEEQAMEAEALQAIFDTHFTILGNQKWRIEIYPEMTSDPDELHELNHVAINLIAELPSEYPETLPILDCQIVKGLVDEHRQELLNLAQEEAAANEGVPSIFAIAERLREWLAENNQKGLDDLSMHAQMIRKQLVKEKEQKQQAEATLWESQETTEEFTAAELEEMAVRKRRSEGTPCNKENFEAWKARFEAEMAEAENDDTEDDLKTGGKKPKKLTSSSLENRERMTGFDYFRTKASNLEALEAAAEAAENQQSDDEEDDDENQLDVDEDLFEDDVDLDDLDFDDEDDDEEDVDI